MEATSAVTCRFFLQGGWTVDRAGEQRSYLLDELSRVMESEPRPARAEIDLSQVGEVDACGCQLLAVFLQELARRGIGAVACEVPRRVADKIEQLGFGGALCADRSSTRGRP